MKNQMFPTRKEIWIHDHAPKFVLPMVWISSVAYLTDQYSDSALGIPVMLGSFIVIPLVMAYIMRVGEFTAVESLMKGLEHAEKRGNHYYGGRNFNQDAKEYILGWWLSNSKNYLR